MQSISAYIHVLPEQGTLVLRISQNSAICTETKTLSQLVIVKKTG